MYKFKREKGITLIALIITIIVLLILAVVTIKELTDSSIINYAQNSANDYKAAKEEENTILHSYDGFIDEKLQIEKNEDEVVYNINVNITGCEADDNNPTTIKAGEKVVIIFYPVGASSDEWNYNINGADFKVASIDNLTLKLEIINPKSDGERTIGVIECCFVSGTQVWMEDGTTKNIEDVEIGDVVLSYNETTSEYENCVVTKLITNPNTTNLARVILVDGTTIEMNEYHPIYTKEGWKSLTNYKDFPTLTKEDEVLSTNGKYIKIDLIERWTEEMPITTYNLTVEKNHNYFVGRTPTLVHNAGCPQ